jgi:hypothetical protein
MALTVLLLGVLLCGATSARWWRGAQPLPRPYPVFHYVAVLLLAHMILMKVVLEQFSIEEWYYQPHRAVFALGLAHMAFFIPSRRTHLWAILGIVPAVLVIYAATEAFRRLYAPLPNDSLYIHRIQMGRWIRDELPPDAIVGAWNSGQIGYFAWPHPVANLDGLVSSKKYLRDVLREEVLAQGTWKKHFRDRGIRYLADYNGRDSTQTFQRVWDEKQIFRDIVPFNQAKVVHREDDVLLLDISEWLDSD